MQFDPRIFFVERQDEVFKIIQTVAEQITGFQTEKESFYLPPVFVNSECLLTIIIGGGNEVFSDCTSSLCPFRLTK